MNELDLIEKSVLKSLEKAIEMGYLTKNEYINLEAGVAIPIASDVRHVLNEQKKNEELSMMFELMNKHMPDKFPLFLELLASKKGKE